MKSKVTSRPVCRANHTLLAVDGRHAVVDVQTNTVVGVPFRRRQGEFFRPAMLEILGEIDAIVSGARLLGEGDDAVLSGGIELDEALAEAMPDHAVADDHYRLRSFADHEYLSASYLNASQSTSHKANSIPAFVYAKMRALISCIVMR